MQADEEVGAQFGRQRGAVVEVEEDVLGPREDDFVALLLEEELQPRGGVERGGLLIVLQGAVDLAGILAAVAGVEQDPARRRPRAVPEERHEDLVVVALGDGEVAALRTDGVVEHHLDAVDDDEVAAVFGVEAEPPARGVTLGRTGVAAQAGAVAQAELTDGFTEEIIRRGGAEQAAGGEEQEDRRDAPHGLIRRRLRRCPPRSRLRRLLRPGLRCARACACSAGRG